MGGAVDAENGAGDIAGERAGEKEEGVGDVDWFPDATERDVGGNTTYHVFGQGSYHVGASDARGDSVDADMIFAEFASEGFGETIDGEFGSGITAAAGLTVETDHGAGVNNASATLVAHVGCDGFGAIPDSFDIEIHNLVEIGFGIIVE